MRTLACAALLLAAFDARADSSHGYNIRALQQAADEEPSADR
jgi:hypothetical protein